MSPKQHTPLRAISSAIAFSLWKHWVAGRLPTVKEAMPPSLQERGKTFLQVARSHQRWSAFLNAATTSETHLCPFHVVRDVQLYFHSRKAMLNASCMNKNLAHVREKKLAGLQGTVPTLQREEWSPRQFTTSTWVSQALCVTEINENNYLVINHVNRIKRENHTVVFTGTAEHLLNTLWCQNQTRNRRKQHQHK